MPSSFWPIAVAVLAIAVIVGGVIFWLPASPAWTTEELTAFATCLAEKKVTMYGAVWCSHCQSQKTAFGESFRLVPYVECPDNIKACLALGVESYPTWILSDGRKLVGEQDLEKLADESGCPLGAEETTAH